jgi:gluconokinase
MPDDPTILIITGVSGSGKTTIATALAQRLHWPFKEGADLHPASDISKMHAGHPLDDRDQWPLLERVADWIDGWRQAGQSFVIACSMLKRSYRDFLTSGRPEVRVVHLHGDRALIGARLAARKEHITSTTFLDTQFAVLEGPDPDEDPIRVDVGRPASRRRMSLCFGNTGARWTLAFGPVTFGAGQTATAGG